MAKNIKGRRNINKNIREEYSNITRKASNAITQGAREGLRHAQSITPVWTGLLRYGWRLGITKSQYAPKRTSYKKGSITKMASASDFKFYITKHRGFTLYNNVEYADYINTYGSKWGRGVGMLEEAMNKMDNEIQSRLNAL